MDEQRGTMVRGRKGGWRRSLIAGWGDGRRGFTEPFCGLYACSDAIECRCVRIRIRILMSRRFSDVSSHACPAPRAGTAGVPAIVAHAPIFLAVPHFSACFILTTLLLRIVMAE
ncbi:hypothetical protein [Burkholderia cenocepacia]|uniref:hypothetical protein n=1 Tax=Burkholderia cenocepacia TaxID=95486 RepID=UPI00163D1547|nr:hypothetical protein [Burkholderia cenocepacia]